MRGEVVEIAHDHSACKQWKRKDSNSDVQPRGLSSEALHYWDYTARTHQLQVNLRGDFYLLMASAPQFDSLLQYGLPDNGKW